MAGRQANVIFTMFFFLFLFFFFSDVKVATISYILYLFGQGSFIFVSEKSGNFEN